MDIKPYEYIMKVAELQSITKAAQTLYVSQPYLSSYISRLEEELGILLFDRNTKPISLTLAGDKYLEMAKNVLNLHNSFKEEIVHIENHSSGRLSVGIPRMRATFLLPHILPLFYDRFPNVELIIREGSTKNLEELLKKGEISFSFTPIPGESTDFQFDVLYDEELLLVTEEGALAESQLERDKPVPLEVIRDFPFLLSPLGRGLRTALDQYFLQNKFKPKVRLETSSNETLFRLSSKGIGITIVPHSICLYARPVEPVDTFHLEPNGLFWQIGVVYKKGTEIDYLGKEFIKICRQILPDAF